MRFANKAGGPQINNPRSQIGYQPLIPRCKLFADRLRSCERVAMCGVPFLTRLLQASVLRLEASWRSGYAEDCKSLYSGSNPDEASIIPNEQCWRMPARRSPGEGTCWVDCWLFALPQPLV